MFSHFIFEVIDDFLVLDCLALQGFIFELLVDEIILQRTYFGDELDEIFIVKAIFEGLISDECGFVRTGGWMKESFGNFGGLVLLVGCVQVRVG